MRDFGARFQFTARQCYGILRQMTAHPYGRSRSSPPVSGAYARALLRRFASTPDERAALLDRTGLDDDALSAAGSEAPVDALLVFAANLTRIHGPAWAVDAGAAWSAPLQGGLDLAIRSAPTPDEALAVAARYGRVRAPYLTLRLETNARLRRIVVAHDAGIDDAVWRTIAEAVALSLNALFAQVFEEDLRHAAIDFPWPEPAHAEKLRALMPCTARFSRADFAFEAPAALCRRASPFADPALHTRAVADLEEGARRIGGATSLKREVERIISTTLPRRLGEEEAARRLGLSRRTLVRRLSAEGVSFRGLVDDVLCERARAMRGARDLSRDAMAARLGYADPTSFSRACRRWSGAE